MFDTYITVVGTVLNTPEWRQVAKTNAVVANFRVASNARRYDKESEQWVDGASLRVRVNCWRRLAEGVCASIIAGDPVVVHGRIATREWKNEQGETRMSYELDAVTVGHDLSRGQGRFKRMKLETISSVVEDADSEGRVNGEVARSVATLNATRGGAATDPAFDDFDAGGGPDGHDTGLEALAILRGAGLVGTDVSEEDAADDDTDNTDGTDEEELVGAPAALGGPPERGRRRGRTPVPA